MLSTNFFKLALPFLGIAVLMGGCGAAPATSRHVTSTPAACADEDDAMTGTPIPVTSGIELSASERTRRCSPVREDIFAGRR